jgi:hypothetical protein
MKLDLNKKYPNNFEVNDVEWRTAGPTEKTTTLTFPTQHVLILVYSEYLIRKLNVMKQMFLSLILFAQNKRFNDELITKLSEPRSNFMCHSELFFISPL